jgi:uncharacterized protein
MIRPASHAFDEHEVLHKLKHYLPAQAPLKDFVHHNTLHGFQHLTFSEAIRSASEIFGFRVSLSLTEYRNLYHSGQIKESILKRIIVEHKGEDQLETWMDKVLNHSFHKGLPRIGQLRANWKREYAIDLDSLVHPLLFRILCSYLDQGIALWVFPITNKGFLSALRELERNSFTSFFKTDKARDLLLEGHCTIKRLLKMVVGQDESLFEQYLFDQQFAHQGWSGMVAAVETQPESLLDHRKISLHDLIVFELLLELDALSYHYAGNWLPLQYALKEKPAALFQPVRESELDQVTILLQEAYEWSYYDEVLAGTQHTKPIHSIARKSFQALFCIDDRCGSLRRYLEMEDKHCETFGTPGFFGVEFFYKPDHGKFYTKLCPAPVTPKHLIKEIGVRRKHQKDVHFTKQSHGLFRGWLITQTIGFWSALKLFLNIFRPSMGPATASSFQHMEKHAALTVENKRPDHRENDLQIGFTVNEMADRVEVLLKSIGLVKDFAPLLYVIGHGASSVNNPHYAGYDCGACSGRAGSVNARVLCTMANHKTVRGILKTRNMDIPDDTLFVGGLHDTTRDEIMFFDEELLPPAYEKLHRQTAKAFLKALEINAKERSRRFASIDTKQPASDIHDQIKKRSVSLFEPRPELNHATNALCIVGRRSLSRDLFLDRRAFLNSFDYRVDPEGTYLYSILKAVAPVCGGINLEYYFSRVDNQKLGAGTKLPHNVMGLFGVANGIDGDLRPGLPSQMIEIHDPIRLMVLVEHEPEVVLQSIQVSVQTYEWFLNTWIHLVVIHPETKELFVFRAGEFYPYTPVTTKIETVNDIISLIESSEDNLPVCFVH